AALAAGLRSGVPLQQVREGLESMRAVFGRVETIDVASKPVSILLIKNPAGANEVLRTLTLESSNGGIDLWLALNDRIADGRDVSWIWDADFELLSEGVRRAICAGTRAAEMALRLKYAGWPEDAIEVIEPIETSLDAAVSAAPERLFALPTYTALLELRTLLADRGLAADFWQ
ncbi:MAG: MurT ligase domain-containing protein, partial [Solirubrobacterales bacterium]